MSIESIEAELNRLYQYEIDRYIDECNIFKKAGYKIYRNSQGQHKVITPKKQIFFGNDFGDIFNNIFSGVSNQ